MQPRILGLDIVRSLAILFVIAGHFTAVNTPFGSSEFGGFSMFFQLATKTLFYIGVPLFLILTGYLNSNKRISKDYFNGGLRVIVSYVLFSIITILFRKYYINEDVSWLQWGHKVLNFSAIPYAWYIEMWIGLFLLTPFLNIMYHNIPTQKQKLLLIGILFVLTAVPFFVNRDNIHVVPDFWRRIYPLLFFFLGLYINEYKPVINKKIAWSIITGICLINPLYLILSSQNEVKHVLGSHFSVFGVILACSFFLAVYKADVKRGSFRKIITKISILSLDVYLCCWIFDQLVYPYFINHFYINQSQFGIYSIIIVPIVFILSFIFSLVIDFLKKKVIALFN